MYTPPAFREDDTEVLHGLMRATRLCTVVTATAEGLQATPLPVLFEASESAHGALYGHVAKANPQWRMAAAGDALAIFMGADAYITPNWYAAKEEHHKVVPTWNYETVHAHGPIEFFAEPDRLLDVVTKLTDRHEARRDRPWSVSQAPEKFVRSQLRGIVGFRLEITRLEGKRKMSQNRPAADRLRVAAGLAESDDPRDRIVSGMIPVEPD